MKTIFKIGFYTLLFAGVFSFQGCKDKNGAEGTDADIDTTYVEGDNMNDMDTGTDTVTVNPDTIMGP